MSLVSGDGIGAHFTYNSYSVTPGYGASLTLTQYVFTNKNKALVKNLNGNTEVTGISLLFLTGSYGTSYDEDGSVLYRAYEYGFGYGELNKLVPARKITENLNFSGGLPLTVTIQLGYHPFKR